MDIVWCWLLCLLGSSYALWPQPRYIEQGSSIAVLSRNVTLEISTEDEKVQNAVRRALEFISTDNFYPWMFHSRGRVPEVVSNKTSIISILSLSISTEGDSFTTQPASYLNTSESYKIEVTSNKISIISPSSNGALHALTTLPFLFTFSKSRNVSYVAVPLLIQDSPRFEWRGLNLDVSRHFYPVQDIKRTIDAMSWVKMNKLHLHITDSQSWPLEIPSLPDLAREGAYSSELIYSIEDIEDLKRYADDRGIDLVLEIDMPGHTGSIGYAYPDLTVGVNVQPWNDYAAEPPSGQLKLNDSKVEAFVTTLFDDLLPRVQKYFHTGGDEVNQLVYQDQFGANTSSVLQGHLSTFVLGLHKRVYEKGLTPIVWEEMLLDWNITLDKTTIVQTWTNSESTKKVASRGYRVIVGNYQDWYLDCGKGQWLDFQSTSYSPFLDYCNPVKNWRQIYTFNPTEGLTSEEAERVIGAETHLWSEQSDAVNLDRMLWPRVAVAAEVMWSDRVDTLTAASRRLNELRYRLVDRGISAEPLQPIWCSQNPGGCIYDAELGNNSNSTSSSSSAGKFGNFLSLAIKKFGLGQLVYSN